MGSQFILGILVALSVSLGQLQADPGFTPIDSPKVDLGIRRAARSIFKLVFYKKDDAQSGYRIYASDYEGARARLEQHFTKAEREEKADIDIYLTQLRHCQAKQSSSCWIGSVGRCSGTLFAHQDLILTAAHCFPHLKVEGEEAAKMKNKTFDLMLVNHQGEVVFDSQELPAEGRPKIELWGPAFDRGEQQEIAGHMREVMTDIALIRLPIRLALEPLRFGLNPSISKGDQVQAVGFPGTTFNRRLWNNSQDSDGIHMVVVRGQAVGNAEDYNELFDGPTLMGPRQTGSASPVEELRFALNYAWASDFDGREGLSGGPVFDHYANIIGVVSRATFRQHGGIVYDAKVAPPLMTYATKLAPFETQLRRYFYSALENNLLPIKPDYSLPVSLTENLRKAGNPMADIAPIGRETNFRRR